MSKIGMAALMGAVWFFACTALTGAAHAGLHLNRNVNPGKGCGQLVTVKHPDLKGKARKAEWDKCMANPDTYGT